MSNSALAKVKVMSPSKTSPRDHAIDTITIHCMAGQATAKSCGQLFAQASRQTSSNYGIGPDGEIGLYVDEKDRSWCTSNRANDMRAITIEVASDSKHPYAVTDKAYAALIELVADVCKRNGIKKLVWSTSKTDRVNHKGGCNMTVHRDYANKACPGDYLYNKMGEIASKVNAKIGATTAPAAKPTTSAKPTCPYAEPSYNISRGSIGTGAKWVQWHLNRLGYDIGKSGVDGIVGSATDKAIRAFQKAKKLAVDGIVGKNTKAALKAA